MPPLDTVPHRTALDLPHGLHEGIPEPLYHAKVLGLASKHALDEVLVAPAKYRAWIDAPDEEPTPAMRFGSDFHKAVLEPHLYEPRSKTAKDREDAVRIEGMRRAVLAHPIAGRLLTMGKSEVTARWRDPETGIECKARADRWVEELSTVADLKSCSDASPEEFARSVANYGYHAQEAMYREGFALAGGGVEHFVFIACEKSAPFLVAVYTLDVGAVTRGERRIRRALRRLHECIAKDEWPGYSDAIREIELPKWAND